MEIGDRKLRIDRYRMEPYFPRPEDQRDGASVYYMLSLPMPLDKEQMTLILSMISEMKRPRDFYMRGIMLESLPRLEEVYSDGGH